MARMRCCSSRLLRTAPGRRHRGELPRLSWFWAWTARPPGSAAWTFHGKPLTTGALIPVADIRVPVLLSDGGQDLIGRSAPSATQDQFQELRHSADHAPYTNLYYPGAGHIAAGFPPEFPYSAIALGTPRGGTRRLTRLPPSGSGRLATFLDHPSAPLK